MAIAVAQEVVSGASLTAGPSTTIAASITPGGAGSILFGLFKGQSAAAITATVSDSVNGAWTVLDTIGLASAGEAWCVSAYVQNASASACTVTATFSGSMTQLGALVIEITGGKTSGALADHNALRAVSGGSGSTDSITSGNVTTGSQPALVVGFVTDDGSGATASAGTGFTAGSNHWGGSGDLSFYESQRVTVTGTYAVTATPTSFADTWLTNGAIFLELGAGGATNPPFDQQPARRPVRVLLPSARQTEVPPQVGVKTGTGPWDQQGRVARALVRLPSARQTEVPPQIGVKTGTGPWEQQGQVRPALVRLPSAQQTTVPPQLATVAAPPPVFSPTSAKLIYLPHAPQQTEVPPQLGVFTGSGLPDQQGRVSLVTALRPQAQQAEVPPVPTAAALPPVDPAQRVAMLRVGAPARATDAMPPPPVALPPPDAQQRVTMRLLAPRNANADGLPPRPPTVFAGILDIQPVRWLRRLVKGFVDAVWWPQTATIVVPFQPGPFTIVPVDVVLSIKASGDELTVVPVDVVLTIREVAA